MKRTEYIERQKKWMDEHWDYEMCHHSKFDYWILKKISYIARPGCSDNAIFNDAIIMVDTETSKKSILEIGPNHICAWTISIRAFDRNIVTLWGHKPTTLIQTINKITRTMPGDKTVLYVHNLSYDWVFIRQYAFSSWGYPSGQLNVKSHYPVKIEFDNGIILKDSLILAQRSLDKWAKDLGVEHQKAVGKWDYDKIRNQNAEYNADELEYIEHDTLAGVECIQKTMDTLKKRIYSMPYTATGIPREEVYMRGRKNNAHQKYLKSVLSYEQQIIAEKVFHGGYTHSNRYLTDITLTEKLMESLIECYDFSSSYPYVMLAYDEFPCEAYYNYGKADLNTILKSEGISFMFKLIMTDVELKSFNVRMPVLQHSKCVRVINPVLDNGRILSADYVEIYINNIDAEIIVSQYSFSKHICSDVMAAHTSYLPRWFTDYVYELYSDKCTLKNGDPVLYAIQKAKLNSLYGLCCQLPVKDTITEQYETGEYIPEHVDLEELYNKTIEKYRMVLNYQWGSVVTSLAMRNLFKLGECIDYKNGGEWIYSDTDSCYGTKWDKNKIEKYNQNCKELLKKNGYDPVVVNGREFIPGIAEFDGAYTEFRVLHSKCYAGRKADTGELKITVAGVPKRGAKCLKDDINNFKPMFVFDGLTSGKKQHTYFYLYDMGKNRPYIDEWGNETGDSIDLSNCDYRLSGNDFDWDEMLTEEISIQVYEEL